MLVRMQEKWWRLIPWTHQILQDLNDLFTYGLPQQQEIREGQAEHQWDPGSMTRFFHRRRWRGRTMLLDMKGFEVSMPLSTTSGKLLSKRKYRLRPVLVFCKQK